jgi:hypothetical protein
MKIGALIQKEHIIQKRVIQQLVVHTTDIFAKWIKKTPAFAGVF